MRPAPARRKEKPAKELYRQLRTQTCERLWAVEVAAFDRATAPERIARVAVVRAVGTVLAASGTVEQLDAARAWLRALLHDPAEKVRRYAAAALAALGASPDDEALLLSRLRTSGSEREREALGRLLAKIGGAAALTQMREDRPGSTREAERKLRARLAREQDESRQDEGRLNGGAVLRDLAGVRIHLRGRRGYEQIVADEAREAIAQRGQFRIDAVRSGLVALHPLAAFSLHDLYRLRCFDTLGFVVASTKGAPTGDVEAVAEAIVARRARTILQTWTQGALRYRMDFVARGHQRAAIRAIADRAYELWPELLNDPRRAPWSVMVHPRERGGFVELVPHLAPDPRLQYRTGDVAAASHPRLAACMARLAGATAGEVVWDPFCGSGLELIERALLGGVRAVYGSDVDAGAVRISQRNFAAAGLAHVHAAFACADFRDAAPAFHLGPGSVSLILTNPPMGRRVPTPAVHRLLADLMSLAARVLRPGGRLVLPNPMRTVTPPPELSLQSRQVVDFGGFDCRLEVYRRQP